MMFLRNRERICRKIKSLRNGKNLVIVTWPGVYNYGTCLQSYALQYALEKAGYNVKILARRDSKGLLFRIKRYVKDRITVFLVPKTDKQRKMYRFHRRFQHIVKTSTERQLARLVNKTDVFISGSDQIWNTAYRFSPMMFLDFARDKKRISYSSSIGTNYIPDKYQQKVKEYLLKYAHISVREKTAVKVLSELTGRSDIIQVVDPTFLLKSSDWMDFAANSNYIDCPDKYILCYFVADNLNYELKLKDVREKAGINDVILIQMKQPLSFKVDNSVIINDAAPYDFVYLLSRASLVCTDSFHAISLSLNLSKQFVTFLRFEESDKNSQNFRVYDLLERYGLQNLIYEYNPTNWQKLIAYDEIQQLIDVDRTVSWKYLSNAILD